MTKLPIRFFLLSILISNLIMISGCGSQTPAVGIQPSSSLTSTQPSGTVTPSPVVAETSAEDAGGSVISDLTSLVPTIAEVFPTRTPEPTATPDALAVGVSELIQKSGLSGKTLLWLRLPDWINLGISLLYVLVGYLFGTWLVRWLFPRLVRRTKTAIDDRLLQVAGNELRWLAVVFILQFSTGRLVFIGARTKTILMDIYFFLSLYFAIVILWRLITLAARQAEDRAIKAGNLAETDSLIVLSAWGLRLVLVISAISVVLVHFGVNITSLAVFLGIIGLVLSLAGRDILADIISGAMILIDRPFRIGDRLELPSIESWGDVVDIGMRSTKILSMENRMVVLPNSLIGKNQIINYSYPNPSYFNLVKVVVAYDNDPDQVSEILEAAIRSVEGVQKEREVVAWLMELNEFEMVYWTAWWVATYKDRYAVQDRVNKAMVKALREAGVLLPYLKGGLKIADDELPLRPSAIAPLDDS